MTWSQLARLHEARVIKTMYVWIFIVPVIAKLVEQIGHSADVTIFGHTFTVGLTLPFSWIAFYFSALAFALANVLFQIRCPKIVSEQRDYAEFRRANKGVEHLDRYLSDVDMNWEGLRQSIEHQEKYFGEVAETANLTADDGHLRQQFWAVYARGDRYRIVARATVFLLDAVGGVLILVVMVQNAGYVVLYALQSFLALR